jgi:hypothetical protein
MHWRSASPRRFDVLPPDDALLLLEDELLPQPATKTAPAATAASTAPVFRSALI